MSGPDSVAPTGAAHVQLAGLSKAYGSTRAVDGFSLQVPRGSFTTLLGPSGCGKTTVLRMVAGFVEPDSGQVLIGGVDQVGRPPNLRGVGMVFQDYALFPHMSVRSNLEYGLRRRRAHKDELRERVDRTLTLLDLASLAARYPHQLSGGQQQRVALGRVLVLEPEVLLMDEPFSNLDARLRMRLRAELKELQQRLGITTLYVTHDQEEALSLSDHVVTMAEGRVQQGGSPEEIYLRPQSKFVAAFVGDANLLPAEVLSIHEGAVLARALGQELELRLPAGPAPHVGAKGYAMVRPEHVLLVDGSGEEAGWHASGTVRAHAFFGAYQRYWLSVPGVTEPWIADAPLAAPHVGQNGHRLAGDQVGVTLSPGAASWVW